MIGLGFDVEMARRALQQNGSNIQRAINALIESGGILAPSPMDTSCSTGNISIRSFHGYLGNSQIIVPQ